MRGKTPKLIAVVHAETSTGVLQPLEALSRIAKEAEALFLVDMVTSLGGIAVRLDELGIDAARSGTRKCISCPPGLSPISFSPAALETVTRRKRSILSWYRNRNRWRFGGSCRKAMARRPDGAHRLPQERTPVSVGPGDDPEIPAVAVRPGAAEATASVYQNRQPA